MPELHRDNFTKNGEVCVHEGLNVTKFVTPKKASKTAISGDTFVQFSQGVSALPDYHGYASDLLACHKFSRKQKKPTPPKVHVHKDTKDYDAIRFLAEGKNRSI